MIKLYSIKRYLVATRDSRGQWCFAVYHDQPPPWWSERLKERPEAKMMELPPDDHELDIDALAAKWALSMGCMFVAPPHVDTFESTRQAIDIGEPEPEMTRF